MKKTRTHRVRIDCVEMKRRGAARIYEQVKDLTPEQELEFWQERTEDFRRTLTRAKTKSARRAKPGAGRVVKSRGGTRTVRA